MGQAAACPILEHVYCIQKAATPMNIIDTHAHIYPDKIALKAAASIGDFYHIPMNLNGTVGELLRAG